MINCQKFNFSLFLTIKSVSTGARELNGTSQISLATHNAKGEKREIWMRYRQVPREWAKGYTKLNGSSAATNCVVKLHLIFTRSTDSLNIAFSHAEPTPVGHIKSWLQGGHEDA